MVKFFSLIFGFFIILASVAVSAIADDESISFGFKNKREQREDVANTPQGENVRQRKRNDGFEKKQDIVELIKLVQAGKIASSELSEQQLYDISEYEKQENDKIMPRLFLKRDIDYGDGEEVAVAPNKNDIFSRPVIEKNTREINSKSEPANFNDSKPMVSERPVVENRPHWNSGNTNANKSGSTKSDLREMINRTRR